MKSKREIEEINDHISDALEQWQEIMNIADVDCWAYYLNYTDEDLFNALYIFNHVAQNIAIKKDYYNGGTDIKEKIAKFKEGVKEGFGFDTQELTERILS